MADLATQFSNLNMDEDPKTLRISLRFVFGRNFFTAVCSLHGDIRVQNVHRAWSGEGLFADTKFISVNNIRHLYFLLL